MMTARQGQSLLLALGSLLTTATPLVALSALAQTAHAQRTIKQLEPTYVVVIAERAGVRAGNHDSFYVVTDAKKGEVLTIDGEDNTWSRVVYNTDWPAFVGVGEGTYDSATKTFTLGKQSMLLAYSSINPQYCWQALLPESKPLPSGSKLSVQAEIKDAAGTVKGYRVNAPEGARGYIESRSLRRATKEEADAHRAKTGSPTPAPTPAPAPTPTPAPAPSTPAAQPGPGTSLADPIVPPGPNSNGTPAATPPTNPPATNLAPVVIDQQSDPNAPKPVTPATDPGVTPAVTPTATPPAPKAVDRKTATLEQLEAAFTKVNGKDADIFTAEYDSLLAEINKTIGELGDGPIDSQRKRQLQLRADVLKLRIGVRDSLRKSEEAKRALNSEITSASAIVAEAERSRVYNLVGTLATSNVYDGKNLPVMYRVVSADTKAPVTLGYINPEQEPTLASKVGQLVGVIGEPIVDPVLKVAIIRPVRVDIVGQGSTSPALPLLQPTTVPRNEPAPATPAPASTTPAPVKPVEIVK